jgi:cytosine/adenosine deaminase-related metal-dependent hydrolase
MMAYRKIKGSNIFSGHAFLGAENVLITKPDGTIEAIIAEKDAGDDIQVFDGIISPGFVNAHCHIELSHLKGSIPTHSGLVNFVQMVMKQRMANEKEKQAAMLQAIDELYNSGIVAVGDICNGTDSLLVKKDSKLYWHNFIEVSGFVDAGAQKRFDDGLKVLEQFNVHAEVNNLNPNEKRETIVPHAPYSVSPTLFKLINDISVQKIVSIHNQETIAEDDLYKNKTGDFLKLYENFGIDISLFQPTGKTSFQSWLLHLKNASSIISVHNTFIKEEDLSFARENALLEKLHFCLCPNANLFIENTLPPIDLLLKNNCNIVIGTDSYASNWQLNVMDEINTLQKHFPALPLEKILQWATLNGAKALGIADLYGSFEKGKKPGVVLIDEQKSMRII